MRRMKKAGQYLLGIFAALLLCGIFSVNTVKAESQHIYDNASLLSDAEEQEIPTEMYESVSADNADERLRSVWDNASEELRNMRSEGQLAFFVTTDVYGAYEDSLEVADNEAAYRVRQDGPGSLMFKGIPVIDMKLGGYLAKYYDLGVSFILLTDRRNLPAEAASPFPSSATMWRWHSPGVTCGIIPT